MAEYYLRVEGVNLTHFIDDTTDLSTIRGSGLLLLDAVDLLDLDQPGVPTDTRPESATALNSLRTALGKAHTSCISKGASAGLFSIDVDSDDIAEAIRQHVQSFLQGDGMYRHATFVVDVVRASPDFVADREAVLALNRWQQMQSPSLALPGGVPEAKMCAFTRLRPADQEANKPDGKKVDASASAKQRRDFGRWQKHDFYRRVVVDWGYKAANDLGELTTESLDYVGNLNGKMAVLYVDGNQFGKRQEGCRLPQELRCWDQTIRSLRSAWLYSLLDRVKGRPGWFSVRSRDTAAEAKVLRMEVLMWGGDEFMFVLPAWHGWAVLRHFFEATAGWEFDGRSLTHSAGIVFCHHNAPIARIKVLARDLCELAKSVGEKQQNKFAYLTLESFDNTGLNLKNFFKGFLPKGLDIEDWVLPGEGAASTADATRILKTIVPRSRLQRAAIATARPAQEAAFDLSSLWPAEEIDDLAPEQAGAAWGRLATPAVQRPDCSAAALDRLRAMHLSLLWDYVSPTLPADWETLS